MTNAQDNLERRISQLEVRNRIMMALLLVFAAAGLLAFTGNDGTVRAQNFELVPEPAEE